MSKRVHYLCFYAEKGQQDELVTFPSTWNKIEYISEALRSGGFEIQLLSVAGRKKRGISRSKKIHISDTEQHIYLNSFYSGRKIVDKFDVLFRWLQIVCYLLLCVKKTDVVLIYHSNFLIKPIQFIKKIVKRKMILEVEEIYCYAGKISENLQRSELAYVKDFHAYLCVNDLISKYLTPESIKLVSYGDYRVPERKQKEEHTGIRIVYAGVIEQTRKAAYLAVDCMPFLDSDYSLAILGFGKEENILALKEKIVKMNHKLGREAIRFEGQKRGEEYFQYLQSCDIALSTHCYGPEDMVGADVTFPSKVLSYLANGLRVVAQKIRCLEQSAFGDIISFYESPKPDVVAEAIKKMDLNGTYRGREKVASLNEDFQKKLKSIIEQI